ncbi:enoyl-CoA hydratase/isomerase family protein [Bacillus thermotolerans]|uniref:Enoyl-CoA hydratase n=1 Tax=Bacillus thermotolerans TaxID=1221996 RepID=A0A0F5IB27_BACTR|nr:enoyl-CoA hydratase-related protein [Bacillus thermotolerans]KKB39101.1 Enoyl-CoA hydratase [Bacillus thermotolerans]KKB41612.1 Enoyl-CoA hydratase [Bacillus thermotolerans]KKB42721.1 Enoyl-CoA hydratase [Bacillus thermotolerans]
MANFDTILVEKTEGAAFIIINRPEQRNALGKEVLADIMTALEGLKNDEAVSCVVFTGQGEKSFAAGADIGQLRTRTALDVFNPQGMQEVYSYIEAYDKPTIAMVNGYALGGGCELAMACDIRIASEHAKFGLPELNLAIIPSAGGTQRLARLVGKGKAIELILTGKMITAAEAKEIGLISEAVPFNELKAKAMEIVQQISAKGPLAVKMAKLAIHAGFDTDMKTGLTIEKLAQAILFETEDKNEGTSAFLEKRQPQFTAN